MYNKLWLVALLIFFSCQAKSQFYKSILPSTEFSDALATIIIDFSHNYQNIQGQRISNEGTSETYDCNVTLPGSLATYIYQFKSTKDTTASVQCIMFKGDNYKDALRKYNEVYRMVKRTTVKWLDKSIVRFYGYFEKPNENVRFANSTLNLDFNDERYKKYKADVELISTYSGWEVHLNLQTKSDDYEKDATTY